MALWSEVYVWHSQVVCRFLAVSGLRLWYVVAWHHKCAGICMVCGRALIFLARPGKVVGGGERPSPAPSALGGHVATGAGVLGTPAPFFLPRAVDPDSTCALCV